MENANRGRGTVFIKAIRHLRSAGWMGVRR